ncbi:MAG TPA: TRAP transporter small permease [Vicinamibacteria bacterium]|nr:TRAP transporter small permease [Vicinamibacteria bacterium]
MSRLKACVDRTLEVVLAVLMTAMVLVVLWQVATRFLLRDPSSVTEELARFGLMWLGLLGASYGFGRNAHLAIDLIDPEHRSRGLDAIVAATVVLFAVAVIVMGGFRLVEATLALGQTSTALRFERGYVYLALPLSGVLVVFYTIEAAFTYHLHGSS